VSPLHAIQEIFNDTQHVEELTEDQHTVTALLELGQKQFQKAKLGRCFYQVAV
jgi:hypothetical protein